MLEDLTREHHNSPVWIEQLGLRSMLLIFLMYRQIYRTGQFSEVLLIINHISKVLKQFTIDSHS